MKKNVTQPPVASKYGPQKCGQPFRPHKLFKRYVILPECLMHRTDLSAGAKMVWARIAKYLGASGDAYPSIATLAREVGMNKRTVQRHVQELVVAKLLRVQPRKTKGLNKPNLYYLLWQNGMAERTSAKSTSRSSADPAVLRPRSTDNLAAGSTDSAVLSTADLSCRRVSLSEEPQEVTQGGRPSAPTPLVALAASPPKIPRPPEPETNPPGDSCPLSPPRPERPGNKKVPRPMRATAPGFQSDLQPDAVAQLCALEGAGLALAPADTARRLLVKFWKHAESDVVAAVQACIADVRNITARYKSRKPNWEMDLGFLLTDMGKIEMNSAFARIEKEARYQREQREAEEKWERERPEREARKAQEKAERAAREANRKRICAEILASYPLEERNGMQFDVQLLDQLGVYFSGRPIDATVATLVDFARLDRLRSIEWWVAHGGYDPQKHHVTTPLRNILARLKSGDFVVP
jgi:hypothetical protein